MGKGVVHSGHWGQDKGAAEDNSLAGFAEDHFVLHSDNKAAVVPTAGFGWRTPVPNALLVAGNVLPGRAYFFLLGVRIPFRHVQCKWPSRFPRRGDS